MQTGDNAASLIQLFGFTQFRIVAADMIVTGGFRGNNAICLSNKRHLQIQQNKVCNIYF